ncbi:hypothetical protein GCM10010486_55850 [Nonomuraea roseoviolacea subsp. carminata]|uniref:DnaJ-class molecular chaperone n=1 Tax=Nonomuraea roseoviolacea subsp. carminata TaxID=160689 RepID=A0ABT1JYY4_9ACTN|nr:DnaJ-class molecular chaperone [Nonomuraea roseoviolacea subsp. carminata]
MSNPHCPRLAITRAGICPDCNGAGELTGTPAGNGLALSATCPTCNGTGRK